MFQIFLRFVLNPLKVLFYLALAPLIAPIGSIIRLWRLRREAKTAEQAFLTPDTNTHFNTALNAAKKNLYWGQLLATLLATSASLFLGFFFASPLGIALSMLTAYFGSMLCRFIAGIIGEKSIVNVKNSTAKSSRRWSYNLSSVLQYTFFGSSYKVQHTAAKVEKNSITDIIVKRLKLQIGNFFFTTPSVNFTWFWDYILMPLLVVSVFVMAAIGIFIASPYAVPGVFIMQGWLATPLAPIILTALSVSVITQLVVRALTRAPAEKSLSSIAKEACQILDSNTKVQRFRPPSIFIAGNSELDALIDDAQHAHDLLSEPAKIMKRYTPVKTPIKSQKIEALEIGLSSTTPDNEGLKLALQDLYLIQTDLKELWIDPATLKDETLQRDRYQKNQIIFDKTKSIFQKIYDCYDQKIRDCRELSTDEPINPDFLAIQENYHRLLPILALPCASDLTEPQISALLGYAKQTEALLGEAISIIKNHPGGKQQALVELTTLLNLSARENKHEWVKENVRVLHSIFSEIHKYYDRKPADHRIEAVRKGFYFLERPDLFKSQPPPFLASDEAVDQLVLQIELARTQLNLDANWERSLYFDIYPQRNDQEGGETHLIQDLMKLWEMPHPSDDKTASRDWVRKNANDELRRIFKDLKNFSYSSEQALAKKFASTQGLDHSAEVTNPALSILQKIILVSLAAVSLMGFLNIILMMLDSQVALSAVVWEAPLAAGLGFLSWLFTRTFLKSIAKGGYYGEAAVITGIFALSSMSVGILGLAFRLSFGFPAWVLILSALPLVGLLAFLIRKAYRHGIAPEETRKGYIQQNASYQRVTLALYGFKIVLVLGFLFLMFLSFATIFKLSGLGPITHLTAQIFATIIEKLSAGNEMIAAEWLSVFDISVFAISGFVAYMLIRNLLQRPSEDMAAPADPKWENLKTFASQILKLIFTAGLLIGLHSISVAGGFDATALEHLFIPYLIVAAAMVYLSGNANIAYLLPSEMRFPQHPRISKFLRWLNKLHEKFNHIFGVQPLHGEVSVKLAGKYIVRELWVGSILFLPTIFWSISLYAVEAIPIAVTLTTNPVAIVLFMGAGVTVLFRLARIFSQTALFIKQALFAPKSYKGTPSKAANLRDYQQQNNEATPLLPRKQSKVSFNEPNETKKEPIFSDDDETGVRVGEDEATVVIDNKDPIPEVGLSPLDAGAGVGVPSTEEEKDEDLLPKRKLIFSRPAEEGAVDKKEFPLVVPAIFPPLSSPLAPASSVRLPPSPPLSPISKGASAFTAPRAPMAKGVIFPQTKSEPEESELMRKLRHRREALERSQETQEIGSPGNL